MELIILGIIIFLIFKKFEERKGELGWDTLKSNLTMPGYSDYDWEKLKKIADGDDKDWSPVLSRKYEQNKDEDLPEEVSQVYEVLETVWQNFACEEVYRPLFNALESDSLEVVKDIEESGLSVPMWVYTTLQHNCENGSSGNMAIKRLIKELDARIEEERSMETSSDEPTESHEESSEGEIEDIVDISVSTDHLQQLEKEVDELRGNLVDLYEKVERLEAEAAARSNGHSVSVPPVVCEEEVLADAEPESVEPKQAIESGEEAIELKIATMEGRGDLVTEEEQISFIAALIEMGDHHFEKEDWGKAEPYYVRASDLIEEWKMFEHYEGVSEPLIQNLIKIYKDSRRHYEASRLGIRFKQSVR